VDDCKNLSDHEALIRLISATAQNQFVEFTENKLLYRVMNINTNINRKLFKQHRKLNKPNITASNI
jgi:hypothetical protein